MGPVLAAGVAPPQAQAPMEYAHCQLEEDDQHNLNIEKVVKGTCAPHRGPSTYANRHEFKVRAQDFQIYGPSGRLWI